MLPLPTRLGVPKRHRCRSAITARAIGSVGQGVTRAWAPVSSHRQRVAVVCETTLPLGMHVIMLRHNQLGCPISQSLVSGRVQAPSLLLQPAKLQRTILRTDRCEPQNFECVHASQRWATLAQENARRQAEQDEPGEDGRPKKRGRGRPLGSKTKPRPEDELGPADTVEVNPSICPINLT